MDAITLYQFSPFWGLPNISPFCMKLEGYLKLGGIDYKIKPQNDPRKGPKKKIPYIKIGNRYMGDSERIYDYLKSQDLIDLDSQLTDEERAIHHAMGVMCDDALYFVLIYNRWVDEVNWDTFSNEVFSSLPKMVRMFVSKQVRKKMQGDIVAHGLGLHAKEEIYAMGDNHIAALGEYLGDKTWYGGSKPSKLDVCVVSYVANIIKPPLQNPLKASVQKWPNLITLAEKGLKEIYA